MPVRAPRPPRRLAASVAAALAALGWGCGSASVDELPPPATPRASPPVAVAPEGGVVAAAGLPRELSPPPPDAIPVEGGTKVAVLSRRGRSIELFDTRTRRRLGRASAGVGPTNAVSRDRWLWVTDTQGDALLVFRTRPELELVRRVYLPGGPYAIALDRGRYRLWVTLTGTNELVEMPSHGRPSELRRLPTVRQPNAVAVDPRTDRVFVSGRGALQVLDPVATRRR